MPINLNNEELTNKELSKVVVILLEFIVEMTNHEGIPDMDDFMGDDQQKFLLKTLPGFDELLIGE